MNQRQKGTILPIQGRVTRPPGESCRLKIAELEEKLYNQLILLVTSAIATILMGIYYSKATFYTMAASTFLLSCFYSYLVFQILKALSLLSNYNLGFKGERIVGQILSELPGYRAFHDLQFESYNIDHALVGPGGVYCIETKTRRKSLKGGGHKVGYDGKRLQFPNGYHDESALEQAKRNAKALSQFLEKAAAEKVYVKPIVVIPGWMVNSERGDYPIPVLNHKQLPQIVSYDKNLTPDQIQRIAFQLDQKSLMEF